MPLYETEHDRKLQYLVLDFLQANAVSRSGKPLLVTLTAPNATVDYTWKLGQRIVATAELKRRTVNHDRFPDYMISVNKIIDLKRLANEGYILVLFLDGFFFKKVTKDMDFDIRLGGRTSQSRSKSEANGENCAFIPTPELKPVPNWTKEWHEKALNAVKGI